MRSATSLPTAVVHLAALSSVGDSWRRIGRDLAGERRRNRQPPRGAVRARAPDARLLFVSTGEVYGRAEELPTTESATVAPLSPYAASKAAAEIACEQAARSAGLDVVVARAFQHEGPGRDERFAVGSWTRQIAELELGGGGELRVGDLGAERDICDVRDVCRAYRLLLDPAVPAGTYNIASGRKVAARRDRRAPRRAGASCRSASCSIPTGCGRATRGRLGRLLEAARGDRLEPGDPARADSRRRP